MTDPSTDPAAAAGTGRTGLAPADAYPVDTLRRRRAALFPYLGGRGFVPPITLGLMSAAGAAYLIVLVLHRKALAIDLALRPVEVDRFVAGTVAVAAVGAMVAALPRTVRGLRVVIQLGGVAVAGLFGALAAVNEVTPLRVLVVVAGAAVGVIWALSRSVALDISGATGGWRVVTIPWCGAALGVAAIGAYEFAVDNANWGYELGVAGAVCFLASAVVPPVRPAERSAVRSMGRRPGRAPLILTAFLIGVATIGVAPTAVDLLASKWQFEASDIAGEALLCAATALVVGSVGHWFGRQVERRPAHLATSAQALALAVAGLVAFGAGSVTEVGVLFCWAGASAAAILFAVSSETALLTGRSTAERAATSALLVAAVAIGGGAAMATITFVTGVTRGWIVAVAAAPALVVSAMSLLATPKPGRQAVPVPEIIGPIGFGLAGSQVAVNTDPVTAGRLRPLLTCRGLDVSYDNVQVLFGVDICVEAEQVVALLGTNGAGKTTLLRTIAGLERQGAGTITFAGADISTFDPTWRVGLGINQIAGGQALAEDLTVAENLKLFGYSLGRHRAALHHGIERAFGVFPRLGERRNQAASTLSGGEKQMLALSKALILRPRLLIIDEFSLGLAPKVVGELLPIVSELNADGAAVLLVEQSVNIALSIADHAYCMEKGEMVYDGSADRLRDDPELMRAVYLEGVSKALAS